MALTRPTAVRKEFNRKYLKQSKHRGLSLCFCVATLAQHCGAGLFQCHNGMCVPRSYICDHDDDCGDRSDELNCSMYSVYLHHLLFNNPCIIIGLLKKLTFLLGRQRIQHVRGTTSPAPVAAASTKSGFVMERMTVKTTPMKRAVVSIKQVVFVGLIFYFLNKCCTFGCALKALQGAPCESASPPVSMADLVFSSAALCLCSFKCVIQTALCGTRLDRPPKGF